MRSRSKRPETIEESVFEKLARWTLRSKTVAFALLHEGELSGANPAFTELLRDSAGGWRTSGAKSERYASLEAALRAAARGMKGAKQLQLVRLSDERRMSVVLERVDDEIFALATPADGRRALAEHDIRNHLTAALLHLRLLQAAKTKADVAKRTEALNSLAQQIAALLGEPE